MTEFIRSGRHAGTEIPADDEAEWNACENPEQVVRFVCGRRLDASIQGDGQKEENTDSEHRRQSSIVGVEWCGE